MSVPSRSKRKVRKRCMSGGLFADFGLWRQSAFRAGRDATPWRPGRVQNRPGRAEKATCRRGRRGAPSLPRVPRCARAGNLRTSAKFDLAETCVTGEVNHMASIADQTTARVIDREEGGILEISLAGVWRITDQRPLWADLVKTRHPSSVRVRMDEVERWD